MESLSVDKVSDIIVDNSSNSDKTVKRSQFFKKFTTGVINFQISKNKIIFT